MLADAMRMNYGYDEWATAKIFDAATGLSAEQLDAQGPIPHGSIRATLLHLLSVHRRYLMWWDGSLGGWEAYSQTFELDDYPDVASLRAFWSENVERTCAFNAHLTDEDAGRFISTTMPDGNEFGLPLWQMMQHVSNHSTQHRSEIAVMLTGFGHSPGDVDMLFYQMESHARA